MRTKIFNRLISSLIVGASLLGSGSAYATRLVVLSDIHVTPGNANEHQLRLAVDEINAMTDVDAVVVCGDLTNEGSNEQLENVKSILDLLKTPTYFIPGNHEDNWSQSAATKFVRLWGADRFAAEIDDLVIIGTNCGPYMKMGDGHVKQEDLHWIKATLDERLKGGNKRVISFNHYPLDPQMDNYMDYMRVLQPYPVIAHINGHCHQWKQYKAADFDCMMVRALDMRNGNYGYTMLDIDADSVRVLSKHIGAQPTRKAAWAANTRHEALAAGQTAEPVAPEGFSLTKLVEDKASIFTRLGLGGRNLYYGTSDGHVRAIDRSTGAQRWSEKVAGAIYGRTVPVADESFVVVPCDDEQVVLLSAGNGQRVGAESGSGPFVADAVEHNGFLYLGGFKSMQKRDTSDADMVWYFSGIGNYCQAEPVVDNGQVIFGAWDTNLYCLSDESGELLWKWNNGKPVNLYSPGNVVPAVTDRDVIIVAPDRYMTAIDRTTGQTRWRDNSHKFRESMGQSPDRTRVYAKTMDGTLVVVDATADRYKEIAEVDLGLGYEHAPCIVAQCGNVIYCGSRKGEVVMVDATTLKPITTLKLGNSEVNGFETDSATGEVFLSLVEGRIWRIAKK